MFFLRLMIKLSKKQSSSISLLNCLPIYLPSDSLGRESKGTMAWRDLSMILVELYVSIGNFKGAGCSRRAEQTCPPEFSNSSIPISSLKNSIVLFQTRTFYIHKYRPLTRKFKPSTKHLYFQSLIPKSPSLHIYSLVFDRTNPRGGWTIDTSRRTWSTWTCTQLRLSEG